MQPRTKRLLLFMCVCIPARTLLGVALMLHTDTGDFMRYVAALLTGVIAVGFLYQIKKTIMAPSGTSFVGAFGGDVWWPRLRALHVMMYGLSSFILFFPSLSRTSSLATHQPVTEAFRFAGLLILLDTTIGFLTGVLHHAYSARF